MTVSSMARVAGVKVRPSVFVSVRIVWFDKLSGRRRRRRRGGGGVVTAVTAQQGMPLRAGLHLECASHAAGASMQWSWGAARQHAVELGSSEIAQGRTG